MNDKIKKEEQEHLNLTYEKLENEIKIREDKTIYPDGFIVSNDDKENRAAIVALQYNFDASVEHIVQEIEQLKEIQEQVYFSRIDLKDNQGKIISYYISKKPFDKIGTIDWRSDIGSLIYDATRREYNNLLVTLKREFDISFNNLISYHEILSENSIKDKRLSDAFLIKILEKRKNEPNISDIITSIQKDQNEIIRCKHSYNLLVMGCAGSGKTMILLHRLSYLGFNKNIDYKRIKIFVPNNSFVKKFEKLHQELGLYEIKMMPIVDYFKGSLEEHRYLKSKKTHILSEYDINGNLLSEIYSLNTQVDMEMQFEKDVDNFLIMCQEFFNENWQYSDIKSKYEFLEEEIKPILNNIAKSVQKEYYNILSTLNSVFNKMLKMDNVNKVNDFIKHFNVCNNKLSELLKYLNNLNKEDPLLIITIVESISSSLKELQQIIKNYKIKLKEEIENTNIGSIVELKLKQIDNIKEFETNCINLIAVINKILKLKELLDFNLTKWYDEYMVKKYFNPKLRKNGFKEIVINEKNHEITCYNFYYVFLLYLILFAKDEKFFRDELICIDEFQDISLMELNLLYKMNKSPVFNLFGDFRQSVLTKGIKSENDLDKSYKRFEMNNNYRNTNQITEFYNKMLDFNDRKIGVNGPDVSFVSLDRLKEKISNDVNEDSIIICTKADEGLFSSISKRIGLIHQVKGLEYKKVYVYDKNMNNNEKYIAYTRALNELIIIN